MASKSFLVVLLAVVLVLAHLLVAPVTATEVYVKLLPAKELCVGHYVFRDPEGDPVKVAFNYRTLTPRLTAVKFAAYAPSDDINTRGPLVDLDGEALETYGDLSSLYFDAETTGVYLLCFKTRLRTPVISMEMYFSSSNELIEPPTVDGGEAVAIDKPIEIDDYNDRLNMLDISVRTTRDELRMAQTRRFMFDHTSKSVLTVTIGFSLFNMVFAVVLSVWSERFMERYFIKEKSD